MIIRRALADALHALRRSTPWWVTGTAVFVVMNTVFWPSLRDSNVLSQLSEMSPTILEAFGAQGMGTAAGYLDGQLFALMLPMILSAMAVAQVSALTSGDEDAGRLELLHALSVARRTIWLVRFTGALIAVTAAGAVIGALLVAVRLPFGFETVGVGRIVAAVAACVVLGAFHGTVAFALGAAGLRRPVAVGGAILVAAAAYLADFVLPIADSLRGARRLSPWYWAIGKQPIADGIAPLPVCGLAAAGVALLATGVVLLERRDIRSV